MCALQIANKSNVCMNVQKFKNVSSPFKKCCIKITTNVTYILLTKREGRTGRILARGLDSMDRVQQDLQRVVMGLNHVQA